MGQRVMSPWPFAARLRDNLQNALPGAEGGVRGLGSLIWGADEETFTPEKRRASRPLCGRLQGAVDLHRDRGAGGEDLQAGGDALREQLEDGRDAGVRLDRNRLLVVGHVYDALAERSQAALVDHPPVDWFRDRHLDHALRAGDRRQAGQDIVERLAVEGDVASIVVTTPDGRLVGVLFREDVERRGTA